MAYKDSKMCRFCHDQQEPLKYLFDVDENGNMPLAFKAYQALGTDVSFFLKNSNLQYWNLILMFRFTFRFTLATTCQILFAQIVNVTSILCAR